MLAFALGALAGGIAVGGVAALIMIRTQRLWDQAEADDADLASRLADCLADCIHEPLVTGGDEVGGFRSPLEIRLGFFRPELSDRAADLLEEAGL